MSPQLFLFHISQSLLLFITPQISNEYWVLHHYYFIIHSLLPIRKINYNNNIIINNITTTNNNNHSKSGWWAISASHASSQCIQSPWCIKPTYFSQERWSERKIKQPIEPSRRATRVNDQSTMRPKSDTVGNFPVENPFARGEFEMLEIASLMTFVISMVLCLLKELHKKPCPPTALDKNTSKFDGALCLNRSPNKLFIASRKNSNAKLHACIRRSREGGVDLWTIANKWMKREININEWNHQSIPFQTGGYETCRFQLYPQ